VSNQRKTELVSDNFGIQSFQGCHGEILPRNRFMPKGPLYPEFLISATLPSSDSRNSKIANRVESKNESSESRESCISGWYSDLPEFLTSQVSEI
jgi:hypothetical protein